MNKCKQIILLGITLLFTAVVSQAQVPNIDAGKSSCFHFRDGEFIVAQFTDMHWTPTSDRIAETEQVIRSVVTLEQPDMILLTGDIVTGQPAAEGWQSLVEIFNSLQTPFVVALGNHDPEEMNAEEIYEILKASPYFANPHASRGTSDYFDGSLGIESSQKDGKAAYIYFFNSHNKPAIRDHGTYDKIKWEQIEWYRKTSRENAELYNNGEPIPALAFFHIPVTEYRMLKDDVKTYGNWEEGIASGEINSGLFSSFLDMGDMMGAFVGHDHNNDFIGIYKDVALAFGRCSGLDAYGDLARGGRIIKLFEGERRFETWVTTPAGREATYYYPSGFNSEDEANMDYSPAIKVAPKEQGVSYTYYEGKFKKVADIAQGKEIKSGTMPYISIAEAPVEDHFAYDFKAYIQIPERGLYRFYTYSDDGSVLYIDNQIVVDNDGGHSARKREGVIALEAGIHELQLLYFEDYMGQTLEVGITGRNISERKIPAEMLFVR